MGEFNGKKFYGYSMDNDPDFVGPTWNTKNFEFSCIRPETVQRAIDKVNSDVGASLKQKKSHLLGKLREKCGDGENEAYPNRDADVETHVSKVQQLGVHKLEQIHIETKQMSDAEKYSSGKSSHSHSGDDMKSFTNTQCQRAKGGEHTNESDNLHTAVLEEYQQPQPAWVEITEPKMATMQMFDLRHPPVPPPPPPPFGYTPNMYQMPFQYMPPSPHMMQTVGYVYNQQQMMDNFRFQNPYGDYDPNAYLVEDSDLEDEMLRRQHYTKLIQKRPDVKEVRGTDENESCAEFVNIAPQEPYTDMSYLKSTVPMRYSEMTDEETQEDAKEPHPKVIIKKRKQSHETSQSSSKLMTKNPPKKESKKEKPTKSSKASTFVKLLAEEKMIASQHEKGTKVSSKRAAKYPQSQPTPRVSRKVLHQNRLPPEPNPNSPEFQKMVYMPNGRSLDQLKAEKVAIFNKMSRTHERLIDALQQLREKLLEVYVPESTSDRNRRNRNGFEFSVRFLRNFLYPLKGMIDTMRNTSRENFNSIKSNDACNRVAHIYSLFLQAVFTYSKQLRHFMIDQVPQKLTTLLEMLFSTTNMCLDKRLFDRNDAIVECLLSQCSSFLSFLEDLHAQRFVAARECYRKNTAEQQQSKFDLKMFMNDLNMYEPKLVPKRSTSNRQNAGNSGIRKPSTTGLNSVHSNTVNAQEIQQPPRRVRKRVKQSKNTIKHNSEKVEMTNNNTSEVNQPRLPEDDIFTQVQNWEQFHRSSDTEQQESREILENLQNILQQTPDLDRYKKVEMINRSILNALHSGKTHQTREILQPLLKTIDAVRKIPKGDNEIENILKAFQMKISTLLNERKFQQGCGKGYIPENAKDEQNTTSSQCEEEVGNEVLDEQSDSNEEQSDAESDHTQSNQNYENDTVEDEDDLDIDGQFYISGEDCCEKRTTARSRKSKLEPLIEIVDESEAAVLYSSDTELYTPLRVNYRSRQQQDAKLIDIDIKQAKPSPYDVPLSRRSQKSQKKCNGHHAGQSTKKSNRGQMPASSKMASTKSKLTTVPPSPAMMRLQQRGQSPLTERSKRNKLLKKHIRRNPMASPPPPPTVSPSTSVACTASANMCDFHLSLSNTSSSHKGCSANIANNNEAVGSSELSHPTMTHSSNDTNMGTFYNTNNNSSSKNAPRRPSTQSTESKKSCEAFMSVVEDMRSDDEDTARGNSQPVQLNKDRAALSMGQASLSNNGDEHKTNEKFKFNKNETGSGDHKETSDEKLESCPTETTADKCNEENQKAEFDEEPLLRERDNYLSLCIRNRLYTNPNFASPWRILARLSQQLTREIVKDVESDFNSGVLNFVDDFLDLETRI